MKKGTEIKLPIAIRLDTSSCDTEDVEAFTSSVFTHKSC